MAGGAIRRMLNRKLSMAWEQWQQVAAELAEQQLAIRRALLRWKNAALSAGFLAWLEMAEEALAAQKLAAGIEVYRWVYL
jgi:hypothetical protein